MAKQVSRMSLEELKEEDSKLAAQKREIKERQVDVQKEIEAQQAIANLPPEVQERLKTIRLDGEVKSEGGTE